MKEEESDEIDKRAEVKTWGYMRKWVYEGYLLKKKSTIMNRNVAMFLKYTYM